jgi:hypothetical protein
VGRGVEDRFDVIASGGGVIAATMLLALQAVAVVSLLLVGNPAVVDGSLVSRMRHDGPSSKVNAGLPGDWADAPAQDQLKRKYADVCCFSRTRHIVARTTDWFSDGARPLASHRG